MKKLLLALAMLPTISQSSFAQWVDVSGTNNITNTNSGNVGIGTTTPGTKLEVHQSSGTGQVNVAAFVNDANAGYTAISAAGSSSVVPTWTNGCQILEFSPQSSGDGIVSAYTGNLRFQTTGRADRMTINSTGYVGIGTTSPTEQLSVDGGPNNGKMFSSVSSPDGILKMYRWSGSASLYYPWYLATGLNSGSDFAIMSGPLANVGSESVAPILLIKNSGYVGIGTTNPAQLLDVNGNIGTANSQWFVSKSTTGTSAAMLGVASDNNVYLGDLFGDLNTGLILRTSGTNRVYINSIGNVGIGTSSPDQLLSVNGNIHAQEVLVNLSGFEDRVFKKTYHLPTLPEVKSYIDKNHHLPDVPTEAEVVKNGINLGDMDRTLTKKIEELTLYLIQQKERNDSQQKQIAQQQKVNKSLQRQISQLRAKSVNKRLAK